MRTPKRGNNDGRKHSAKRSRMFRTTYELDFRSVMAGLGDGVYAWECSFNTFEQATAHATMELKNWVDALTDLIAAIKRAEEFRDLDLGWHEPFFQMLEEQCELDG